jgi:glutamate 5-kinase
MRHKIIQNVKRVVVKLGTGVLTDSHKQTDYAQVEQIVTQVATLRKSGKEIVLVTSGAVGAGMGVLGYEKRPTKVMELQACAAVGQSHLMAVYEALFSKHGLHVGQVLLTNLDLADPHHPKRRINAQNTLRKLLGFGVVPIINENDVISVRELKFGDNDWLSALVTLLLSADLLVILTTVDGVIENFGQINARTIPVIEQIDSKIEKLAGGTNSRTAIGGMKSKIEAAKIVMSSGIPLVIASGKKNQSLVRIMTGEVEGTIFIPHIKKLQKQKRWVFFHRPRGAVFVDDGAKLAVRENGKSLLPPGVVRYEGEFAAGDVVRICDLDGTEFARGIANFSSEEFRIKKMAREADRSLLEQAIIENLQRQNLNPIEEAHGYAQLAEQFQFSQEEISAKVGKSSTVVKKVMRLLELPPSVQNYVREGKLSVSYINMILEKAEMENRKTGAEHVNIVIPGLKIRIPIKFGDSKKIIEKSSRKFSRMELVHRDDLVIL